MLTGGELPALSMIDALTRLIPGALGDPDGAMDDSHASGLLEYPHYTRPASFRGWESAGCAAVWRSWADCPLAAGAGFAAHLAAPARLAGTSGAF